MKIVTDTHAHTLVSGHAYSTMKEMISAAAENGMELLALTEHAPAMPGTCHAIYFQNFKVVPRQQCGIELMLGAELNILNPEGEVDLPPEILKGLDLVIASIHGPCYGMGHTVEENTQAYLKAMQNPMIHIIGHPDDGRFPVDFEAIVRMAKETGTALEINNSSLRPGGFRIDTRRNAAEMLRYCKKYETPIVVSSDAHTDSDVGRFPYAETLLEETNFPEKLVLSTSADALKEYISKKNTALL